MDCPHCKHSFEWNDCLTEPGAEPRNGDVGICDGCKGWWAMIEGSPRIYAPTQEEMDRMDAALPASRQRAAKEFKRQLPQSAKRKKQKTKRR